MGIHRRMKRAQCWSYLNDFEESARPPEKLIPGHYCALDDKNEHVACHYRKDSLSLTPDPDDESYPVDKRSEFHTYHFVSSVLC